MQKDAPPLSSPLDGEFIKVIVVHRMARKFLHFFTGIDGFWGDIAALPLSIAIIGFLMALGVRFAPFTDPLEYLDRAQLISGVFLILGGVLMACICFIKSRQSPATRVLRSYIYGAIAFSGIYFLVYYINPSSFSFSSGIVLSVEYERARNISDDIDRYLKETLTLNELFRWIESMPSEMFGDFVEKRKQKEWTLQSGRKIEFQTHAIAGGHAAAIRYGIVASDELGKVEIWGNRYQGLFKSSVHYIIVEENTVSKEEFLNAIVKLKEIVDTSADSRIQELEREIPLQFYLADFVYFSFVTVTTLGYGDMVPNDTLVRLIVVTQIMVGLSLIIGASQQKKNQDP